jgi:hypothetical protein
LVRAIDSGDRSAAIEEQTRNAACATAKLQNAHAGTNVEKVDGPRTEAADPSERPEYDSDQQIE